jgi:hypothetical protein
MDKNKDTKISRKSYDEPKLVEWGKLTKITHGQQGIEEPVGGTNPAFMPPNTGPK